MTTSKERLDSRQEPQDAPAGGLPEPDTPFFGRERELERLLAAIRDRRSLLIFGVPDSGKSALVERALAALPWTMKNACLRVSAEESPQNLLRQLVMRLFAAKDAVVCAAIPAQASHPERLERWVKKQTSGRLRGLVFRAFDRGCYWTFWDDAGRLGLAHSRFLREVVRMRNTPAYLLARGVEEIDIGRAGRIFWSEDQRLELGPLANEEAQALFDAVIEREGLQGLELDEFREQVLEAGRKLPGAIVRMAAMAAQPQYRYGNTVKAKLISMEYLVQLAERVIV